MPVRALRLNSFSRKLFLAASPKTLNARQGIKTYVETSQAQLELIGPKTLNARQGIKTLAPELRNEFLVMCPKTLNARQGIKTQ